MVKENQFFLNRDGRAASLKEKLSPYIRRWPVFLSVMIVSIAFGILLTRYSVPKYIASSLLLVKGADKNGVGSDDLIEVALSGKSKVNLSNEMLMLRSYELMERIVSKNNFNLYYRKKGKILALEIYKDAPFKLTALNVNNDNREMNLQVSDLSESGGDFVVGKRKNGPVFHFRWGIPFMVEGNKYVFDKTDSTSAQDNEFEVTWQPVGQTASLILHELNIKEYDDKTSVIRLEIKTENLRKGADILNAIYSEFSLSDIEERKRLAETTEQFINDRLVNITQELTGVEGNLEEYQGAKNLVDIKNQSLQNLENSSNLNKTLREIGIQQGIVRMISEYFSSSANSDKLVPSALGLNDPTLSSLITQYNELQLKKERESPNVAAKSTVMQDLVAQIENVKGSMLESLNSISRNLALQESNFQKQNSQYRDFLSSMPKNERILQDIKRKQSITEGLYLYLLQKREEAAISYTATNVAHYKQIDPATGYGPVEPNTRNIIIYAGLLGFFLAAGFVYLVQVVNDKIGSRDELSSKVGMPLLGTISNIPRKGKKSLVVLERSYPAEQFRALRTNLYFLLKDKDRKMIMITSSQSGEGKSFTAVNLAAVCAIPGKKVALIDLDLRKPVIAGNLQLNGTPGLVDFLNGSITALSEICQTLTAIPTLHVYAAGHLQSNPADLMLSENIGRLFSLLKEMYDYVIVDTPPIGLVSDAFIIQDYCDIVLYILRDNVTPKKNLDQIYELAEKRRFKNAGIVFNGEKSAKVRYEYYTKEERSTKKQNLVFSR